MYPYGYNPEEQAELQRLEIGRVSRCPQPEDLVRTHRLTHRTANNRTPTPTLVPDWVRDHAIADGVAQPYRPPTPAGAPAPPPAAAAAPPPAAAAAPSPAEAVAPPTTAHWKSPASTLAATRAHVAANDRYQQAPLYERQAWAAEEYKGFLKKFHGPSGDGQAEDSTPTEYGGFKTIYRRPRDGGDWSFDDELNRSGSSVYARGKNAITAGTKYNSVLSAILVNGGSYPSGWDKYDVKYCMLKHLQKVHLAMHASAVNVMDSQAEVADSVDVAYDADEAAARTAADADELEDVEPMDTVELRPLKPAVVREKAEPRDFDELNAYEAKHEPYFFTWFELGPLGEGDAAMVTQPQPSENTSRVAQRKMRRADDDGRGKLPRVTEAARTTQEREQRAEVERARRAQERAQDLQAFKLKLEAHNTRIACAKEVRALAETIGDPDDIDAANREYMSALRASLPVHPDDSDEPAA